MMASQQPTDKQRSVFEALGFDLEKCDEPNTCEWRGYGITVFTPADAEVSIPAAVDCIVEAATARGRAQQAEQARNAFALLFGQSLPAKH